MKEKMVIPAKRATKEVGKRLLWWEAPTDQPIASPLLSILPLSERGRWHNISLTVLIVALVIGSRLAAFPASIWDQDEAYFACAVERIDLQANHPHPPFFPLWIALGKVVHSLGIEPAQSLQLVSCVFSCWMLFPLVALWSRMLRGNLAVMATLVYMATPISWLFAGRAYSETPATALFVAACAWWLQKPITKSAMFAGSVAGGLCILIRPHMFLPILVIAIILFITERARWVEVLTPLGLLGIAGLVGTIAAAGGVTPLVKAVSKHAQYHFSSFSQINYQFSGSGLAHGLGHPIVAGIWVLLSLVGCVSVLRSRHGKAARLLVIGAILPLLVVVYGVSNPAHARYFVPILALTSGFALVALATRLGRWTQLVAAAAIVAAVAGIVPQLSAYRHDVSPPLLAIRQAVAQAQDRNGVIIADRTLISFFDYERVSQRVFVPIVYDYLIETGKTPPPPPDVTTAIFDANHGGLLLGAERQTVISCQIPLLRYLGQNRYLDITVASGARLKNLKPGGGPFILM